MERGTFDAGRRTRLSPCMFQPVSVLQIARGLGGSRAGGYTSVFERMGLDPGRRLGCGTHAFRHLLNDIVLRGGLDASDVALWSGRFDPRANDSYDHIDDEDIFGECAGLDVAAQLLAPPPSGRQGTMPAGGGASPRSAAQISYRRPSAPQA